MHEQEGINCGDRADRGGAGGDGSDLSLGCQRRQLGEPARRIVAADGQSRPHATAGEGADHVHPSLAHRTANRPSRSSARRIGARTADLRRYAHLLQVRSDRDDPREPRRSERHVELAQDGDSYTAVAISDQFDPSGTSLPADCERPSPPRGSKSNQSPRRPSAEEARDSRAFSAYCHPASRQPRYAFIPAHLPSRS